MFTFFNASMNSDSKPSSDNKIPEFFSVDGDKNTEKLSDKKNDEKVVDAEFEEVDENKKDK